MIIITATKVIRPSDDITTETVNSTFFLQQVLVLVVLVLRPPVRIAGMDRRGIGILMLILLFPHLSTALMLTNGLFFIESITEFSFARIVSFPIVSS